QHQDKKTTQTRRPQLDGDDDMAQLSWALAPGALAFPSRRNGLERGRPKRRDCPRVEQLETRMAMSGTWTPLFNLMPDSGSGTGRMMLLSNGTVMVQGGGAKDADFANWYLLTPDSRGSYAARTWSQLASMNLQRLDYASVTLPNGKVMVLGGEYSGPDLKKSYTNRTEIYDPVANTW